MILLPMLAALTTTAALAAAQPTQKWTTSGWYQTEATASDYRIISGPYASKELCTATMSKDTDDASYRCYDMTQRPRWEL